MSIPVRMALVVDGGGSQLRVFFGGVVGSEPRCSLARDVKKEAAKKAINAEVPQSRQIPLTIRHGVSSLNTFSIDNRGRRLLRQHVPNNHFRRCIYNSNKPGTVARLRNMSLAHHWRGLGPTDVQPEALLECALRGLG